MPKLLTYVHVHETHTVGKEGVSFEFNPIVTEVIVVQDRFRANLSSEGITYEPATGSFERDEFALFDGTYRGNVGYPTKAVKVAKEISDDEVTMLENLVKGIVHSQNTLRRDSARFREMIGDTR